MGEVALGGRSRREQERRQQYGGTDVREQYGRWGVRVKERGRGVSWEPECRQVHVRMCKETHFSLQLCWVPNHPPLMLPLPLPTLFLEVEPKPHPSNKRSTACFGISYIFVMTLTLPLTSYVSPFSEPLCLVTCIAHCVCATQGRLSACR